MDVIRRPRPYRLLGLAALAVALQPVCLPARTVLEAGHTTLWKYLDEDVEPDAAWRRLGYDDSRWKSGRAPLGFGETRVATRVNAGPDDRHRPITTWFRREFDVPRLQPGESLVLLFCVDDGAVVYLNGDEIARVNMPAGPVSPATFARRTIGDDVEGFYHRWHVPAPQVRAGAKNVLAIEVHQASLVSSDLFFDLALKVLPAAEPEAQVSDAARGVIIAYRTRHYVGPGVTIPDGYLDGGRGMGVDVAGRAESRREILRIDRQHDAELSSDLAFARSASLRSLPPLERARRIATRIDERTTPPGGFRWVFKTTEQLRQEFQSKPLRIGDWVDQCQAGVCRHRALLFKVLADEAGLRAALVRGNFAHHGPPGLPHAWNEVESDDGQRLLVDVMQQGGTPKFPAVTDPEVVQHYLKVDGTPWYGRPPK